MLIGSSGIKCIKLYAWEESFKEKLAHIRTQELHFVKRSVILACATNAIFIGTPVLVSVVTLTVFTLTGTLVNSAA